MSAAVASEAVQMAKPSVETSSQPRWCPVIAEGRLHQERDVCRQHPVERVNQALVDPVQRQKADHGEEKHDQGKQRENGKVGQLSGQAEGVVADETIDQLSEELLEPPGHRRTSTQQAWSRAGRAPGSAA